MKETVCKNNVNLPGILRKVKTAFQEISASSENEVTEYGSGSLPRRRQTVRGED